MNYQPSLVMARDDVKKTRTRVWRIRSRVAGNRHTRQLPNLAALASGTRRAGVTVLLAASRPVPDALSRRVPYDTHAIADT